MNLMNLVMTSLCIALAILFAQFAVGASLLGAALLWPISIYCAYQGGVRLHNLYDEWSNRKK